MARRGSAGAAKFFPTDQYSRDHTHKTDEPNVVVNFLDADGLPARETLRLIFIIVVQAKTSAAGDHDGAVVERVGQFGNGAMGERTPSKPRRGISWRELHEAAKSTPLCERPS